MTVKTILTEPNPLLREISKEVKKVGKEEQKIMDDMLETMYKEEGIGLAAQQVGKAIQFCVVDVPTHPEYPIMANMDGKDLSPQLLMPMCLANPQIEFLSDEEYYYEEGCLSFPNIKGDVARPEIILVNYQDLDGNSHSLKCDGLLARCIQHEVDHLNGILFTERMDKDVFAKIKADVKELRKNTQSTLKKKN